MTEYDETTAREPSDFLLQEEHLASAPLLEGWAPADHHAWMHGWFFDHPDVEDGTHGHTSSVVEMDPATPPRWIRTDSRVYRLGRYYHPAEREVRYWAQKQSGQPLGRGRAPGGSDNIDAMVALLRSTGRIRAFKIDRLEEAYRIERDRLSSRASTLE